MRKKKKKQNRKNRELLEIEEKKDENPELIESDKNLWIPSKELKNDRLEFTREICRSS